MILTGRDRHVCPKLPVGLGCGRHAFVQGFRVFKPTAMKTESTIGKVLRGRSKPPGELMFVYKQSPPCRLLPLWKAQGFLNIWGLAEAMLRKISKVQSRENLCFQTAPH